MRFTTPTGVLVYDGEPHTPEWYAARREGITGTDLPKILGLSKYGNALSVWRDKRGEAAADEAGEAARWGLLLEAPIADVWAEENNTTCRTVGVLAHGNARWMRASLDRLVYVCPDDDVALKCGLEIKTRSAYVAGKWHEEIPDDVLAQVTWGLLVTGLHHMHIAVLIGGQKLHSYRVDRDAQLEEYLLQAAETVWESVLAGIPPEVHPDAEGVLLRELNAMFAKREGERELPITATDYVDQYRQAHMRATAAEDDKVIAKSKLVQLLGDGETGVIDGQRVFTYKRPKQTEEMTAANLGRLKQECPELYGDLVALGYITKTDPNPKFNLSKRSNTE